MVQDYYKTLGLNMDATSAQINDALNAKQKSNDEAKSKEEYSAMAKTLEEIRQILLNEAQRTVYDAELLAQREDESQAKPVSNIPAWTEDKNSVAIASQLNRKTFLESLKGIENISNPIETKDGYKITHNGKEMHFDLTNNKIVINSLDKETFAVISQIAAKNGATSLDITHVPDKYKSMAWQEAQKQGLSVVGYTPTQQEQDKQAEQLKTGPAKK